MKKILKKNWDLYVMLLLPMLYIIIFKYVPIYGVQMAFRDYNIFKGMQGSPWVGLKYFRQFFSSSEFVKLIGNTLTISIYGLLAGLVFPIILALVLNYLNNLRFKKTVQTITYAPYFISTTVMVSIILNILAINSGPVNSFLQSIGLDQIDFLADPNKFAHVYVWSGIWQYTGYNAIIYIATLSGVDPTLHEAAVMDGANKFQRVWHIDLPSIKSTIIILLIMSMGGVLSTGFEKIYLMQNNLNIRASEVIDTYVYKIGLASPIANYSYPTAIGLFQSLIGMVLIMGTNVIAKKVGGESLW
ncbi:multiple sugar transport system permease protein/putative aldouronate transport system permease protein [Lachnospiraceae bacterium NLAE-zl-G231]|nr:multiple sugar transport system permease protein/putative aldouronate transport system permease protein [Lachnospiraceae bacterium NLAE-zl-G231]